MITVCCQRCIAHGGRSPTLSSTAVALGNAYIVLSHYSRSTLEEYFKTTEGDDVRVVGLRRALNTIEGLPDDQAKSITRMCKAHLCVRLAAVDTLKAEEWSTTAARSLADVVECGESTSEQRALAYCQLAVIHGLVNASPTVALHYAARSLALVESPTAHLVVGLILLTNSADGEYFMLYTVRHSYCSRHTRDHHVIGPSCPFTTTAQRGGVVDVGDGDRRETCQIGREERRRRGHGATTASTCCFHQTYGRWRSTSIGLL